MIPQGFQQVANSTTFQHLPGSIASIRRQDNGNPEASIKDLDPREDFVSWKAGGGLNQSILSPAGSPDLSMMRRFSNGEEVSLEKETLSADGQYQHLEVRQNLGHTTAHLTLGQGDKFQDYKADGEAANQAFQLMNQDFESQWNIR